MYEIDPNTLNFNKYNKDEEWTPPKIVDSNILPLINGAIAEYIQWLPGRDAQWIIGTVNLPGSVLHLTLVIDEIKGDDNK